PLRSRPDGPWRAAIRDAVGDGSVLRLDRYLVHGLGAVHTGVQVYNKIRGCRRRACYEVAIESVVTGHSEGRHARAHSGHRENSHLHRFPPLPVYLPLSSLQLSIRSCTDCIAVENDGAGTEPGVPRRGEALSLTSLVAGGGNRADAQGDGALAET